MKITGDTTRVTPRTNRVFGADFGDWSEVQAGDVLASAVIACSPSGPTFGSPTIGANAAGTANAQANFSATGFSAPQDLHGGRDTDDRQRQGAVPVPHLLRERTIMAAAPPIEAVLGVLGPPPRVLPREVEERLLGQFDRLCWQLAQRAYNRVSRADVAAEADDYHIVAQTELLHAGRHFDAERGLRFMTYAYMRIWGKVRCAVHQINGVIRVPSHAWAAGHKYAAFRDRAANILSLSEWGGEEDVAAPSADEDLGTESLESLHAAVSKLNPREQHVITRRFGLDREPPATLQSLGDELGITKERVRQLQFAALERLQYLLS